MLDLNQKNMASKFKFTTKNMNIVKKCKNLNEWNVYHYWKSFIK